MYDAGMTAKKIAITLPPEQLARARQAVRSGRAESVSAYILRALIQQDREAELRELVDDLVSQHGAPTTREKAWATRVLGRRRKV
jgi:Arc/MetJ-type ribon-helix-helix transcriptional regulator